MLLLLQTANHLVHLINTHANVAGYRHVNITICFAKHTTNAHLSPLVFALA